jgi:hypothetical protein
LARPPSWRRYLVGQGFLAIIVPAGIERALVLGDPFLEDMVRSVAGARTVVHEERAVRRHLFYVGDELLGLVRQVSDCCQCPSNESAWRIGSSETRMTPANGVASSSIRKIAPVTERAHTISTTTTVALPGPKRP